MARSKKSSLDISKILIVLVTIVVLYLIFCKCADEGPHLKESPKWLALNQLQTPEDAMILSFTYNYPPGVKLENVRFYIDVWNCEGKVCPSPTGDNKPYTSINFLGNDTEAKGGVDPSRGQVYWVQIPPPDGLGWKNGLYNVYVIATLGGHQKIKSDQSNVGVVAIGPDKVVDIVYPPTAKFTSPEDGSSFNSIHTGEVIIKWNLDPPSNEVYYEFRLYIEFTPAPYANNPPKELTIYKVLSYDTKTYTLDIRSRGRGVYTMLIWTARKIGTYKNGKDRFVYSTKQDKSSFTIT